MCVILSTDYLQIIAFNYHLQQILIDYPHPLFTGDIASAYLYQLLSSSLSIDSPFQLILFYPPVQHFYQVNFFKIQFN